MTTPQRIRLIGLLLGLCIGCDQVSKAVARDCLASSPPISLLGDVFRLQYSENMGSFLGLGAGLPPQVRFWMLIIIVAVVSVVMLGFTLTYPRLSRMGVIAGSLVAGGGFGNLLDRLHNHGAVIDFMNVGIGKLRTGIFNVADLVIMVGAALFVIWSIRQTPSDPPHSSTTKM